MNILIIIISLLMVFLPGGVFNRPEKIIDNLCKDKYQDCSVEVVNTCEYNGGKIYRVRYGCEDLPSRYYDSRGKLISDECGGLPRINDSYSSDDLCLNLGKNCDFDKNLCATSKQ